MFKFNFNKAADTATTIKEQKTSFLKAKEVDAKQLDYSISIEAEIIKCSKSIILFKRQLSDAKYQAIANEGNEANEVLVVEKSILNGTDLIPDEYEGGMKTWECSIDLVEYLSTTNIPFPNLNILELGCGSALPGLYCLSKGARVDFQDYNEQVIKLITIPNVLLNTINSPSHPLHPSSSKNEAIQSDFLDDTNTDFETIITPQNLSPETCRFFSGDWGSMCDLSLKKYDMILTSETLYSSESIPRLIACIKNLLVKDTGIAYIASKNSYFGCSGGVQVFRQLIEKENVFELEIAQSKGDVRREILKLSWRK